MRRHQWEVTHEDGLRLDLASLHVGEFCVHIQWCRIGVITILCFLPGVAWLFEIGIGESQLHGVSEILDRRDLFKGLGQARGVKSGEGAVSLVALDLCLPAVVADEPVEGVSLHAQKVRELDWLSNGRKADTIRRLVQLDIFRVVSRVSFRCAL